MHYEGRDTLLEHNYGAKPFFLFINESQSKDDESSFQHIDINWKANDTTQKFEFDAKDSYVGLWRGSKEILFSLTF